MNTYPHCKPSGIDWIGEIPEHWEVKKLKYVASNNPSNVDKKAKEDEKAVLLCNYVDVYKNDFITSDIEFMEATASDSQIENFKLKKGDVLVTKDSETPDDIAIPAFVKYDFDNVICGYHLTHIKPNISLLFGEYLFRLLQTNSYKQYFSTLARGVTRYGLTTSSFAEMPTILPPLSEQIAIANYLDRKTAEIDQTIADKEALIGLYEEEKKGLINEAVTKGLYPNVPLKPSGIEWLGDVPVHWEVVPLRRITQDHKQGYYSNEGYIEEGCKLIRISDLSVDGKIDYNSAPSTNISENDFENFGLKQNDFLFPRTGSIGLLGFVQEKTKAVFASYLIRFRFSTTLNSFFLKYYFMSDCFIKGIFADLHGGVNQNIHAENIKNQHIPIPPLPEQAAIVDYIETETAKINEKMTVARQEIELLKEFRQALIFECVTGKVCCLEEAFINH